MKIIIEHGHTKRKIEGPFNLCASHHDLTHLATILNRVLAEQNEEEQPAFYYGWVQITPSDVQESIANTKPRNWDD